jgi:two-component system LytT family response regulator
VKVTTLIVDDEALARNRLRKFLTEEEGIEIVGECANGPEAIANIQRQHPDLVFLDVQMPEVSGFDVIRTVSPENIRAVVFVTAFDRHAVEAFEVHALDYLMKPFTRERLHQAVERARTHLRGPEMAALSRQLQEFFKSPAADLGYRNRIAVKNGGQMVFIKVTDVEYIESAANYAVVHTPAGNHVVRETLTSLEAGLPPRQFLRISRSIIVNLERVKSLQSNPGGEYVAVLQDNRQLPMTRGIREVQERLEYP